MNILHLKYALEIEKTGSMTKAADNLFMSQPTLSRSIKELEDSLGVKIFKRTAKGILPTQSGEDFLIHAKDILDRIDEVEAMFSNKEKKQITLNISAPRSDYICNAFVKTVSQFDKNKDIDVNYRETNAVRAIDNIIQGNYSLGIIKFQEDFMSYFKTMFKSKGLKYELLLSYEANLLVPKNGPLGIKDVVEMKDLEDCIEICFGDPFVPTLPTTTVKKAEFTQSGNKKIMVYERTSVCQLLESLPNVYTWISGMPDRLRKQDAFMFAKTKGIEPKKYVHLLIYKNKHKFTEEEKTFLENLNYFKNIKFGKNN